MSQSVSAEAKGLKAKSRTVSLARSAYSASNLFVWRPERSETIEAQGSMQANPGTVFDRTFESDIESRQMNH